MDRDTGLNLWQRISFIQANVGYVPKDGRNDFHKYNYATESAILDGVKQLMGDVGVAMLFNVAEEPKRTGDITSVHVQFTLINVDKPDEKHVIDVWGEGQDKGDKGIYKAYTGADKYALMKTFLIPTGDDPEKDEPRQEKPKPIQRGNITEERDPGAPPRAKQPFPKAEDPLVVKVNETETFNDIMALRAKWEKADKSKYSEDRIALVDKAIKDRILALTPAEEPNESAESLEIALNEPETPIPATYDEWRELICGTMTVAGLEAVERLVQDHVILNGKMKGAEKKPITDCLKAQKEAINE